MASNTEDSQEDYPAFLVELIAGESTLALESLKETETISAELEISHGVHELGLSIEELRADLKPKVT